MAKTSFILIATLAVACSAPSDHPPGVDPPLVTDVCERNEQGLAIWCDYSRLESGAIQEIRYDVFAQPENAEWIGDACVEVGTAQAPHRGCLVTIGWPLPIAFTSLGTVQVQQPTADPRDGNRAVAHVDPSVACEITVGECP